MWNAPKSTIRCCGTYQVRFRSILYRWICKNLEKCTAVPIEAVRRQGLVSWHVNNVPRLSTMRIPVVRLEWNQIIHLRLVAKMYGSTSGVLTSFPEELKVAHALME